MQRRAYQTCRGMAYQGKGLPDIGIGHSFLEWALTLTLTLHGHGPYVSKHLPHVSFPDLTGQQSSKVVDGTTCKHRPAVGRQAQVDKILQGRDGTGFSDEEPVHCAGIAQRQHESQHYPPQLLHFSTRACAAPAMAYCFQAPLPAHSPCF